MTSLLTADGALWTEQQRTIRIVVLDHPTGKARPRFNPKSGGRPHTPKRTVTAEHNVRAAWEDAGAQTIPEHTPISITCDFAVTRPASHYNRAGHLNAEGLRNPQPCRRKPDIDNALKLVMDALEGYAYPRDVAIVSAQIRRSWTQPGQHEHVAITLTHPGAAA